MTDHDTHTDPLPTLHGPGSIAEAMERLKTLLDRAEALPPIPPIPVVDVEAVKEQTALILRLQAEAWEAGYAAGRNAAFDTLRTGPQRNPFAAPAAKPAAGTTPAT